MPRTFPALAGALLLLGALNPVPVRSAPTPPLPDTVRVAPPTGSVEVDPVRVQEAFDRVQPGDTVLFPAGTYRMGPGARLTVPDVTVLGHPEGTVLQGCEPARFDLAPGFTMDDVGELVFGCTGLFVLADRQTIRGLTFDHTWHGLAIGHLQIGPDEGPAPRGFGGHRIEGNVFRNVPNGIRVVGPTDAVTVIRDNRVLNAFHAFQSNGAPVHVLDNRISVPDPHSVPASRHPESGVILGGGPPPSSCRGSLVAGNVIEGTLHGIQVLAGPGDPCADHEIRGNVVRLGPVPLPADYPDHLRAFYFAKDAQGETAVGIGIRLHGSGFGPEPPEEPTIRDVLIRGNRILGASGLGIQIAASTGVRVLDNHVAGVRRRAAFPAPTWGDDSERWRDADGAGVWISDDSRGNRVAGNSFHDLAGAHVHVDGSDNEIRLRDADPPVVDDGRGNRIRTAQPSADEAAVLAVVDSALVRISAEDMVGFTDLVLPGAAIGVVGESDEGEPYWAMRPREEERARSVQADNVERGFDPEVRLSGPLAMVWLPYDFYTDGAWSHCGVDVFTLFRTGEGWRIASVLYSYEQPPACRRHPDGPPAG